MDRYGNAQQEKGEQPFVCSKTHFSDSESGCGGKKDKRCNGNEQNDQAVFKIQSQIGCGNRPDIVINTERRGQGESAF